MYRVSKTVEGLFALLREDFELQELIDNQRILLTIKGSSEDYQKEYPILETFLRDINSLENIDNVKAYLIELDSVVPIDLDFKSRQTVRIKYNLSWLRLGKEHKGYFADYSYVRKDMPYWSTARKFDLSNHTKTTEPAYTRLKYVTDYLKFLTISEDDVQLKDKSDTFLYEPIEGLPHFSFTLNGKDKEREILTYTLNSHTVIDFGKSFNKLRLINEHPYPIKILIKGIHKNTFTSEEITLERNCITEAKISFSKIFNIEYRYSSLEDLERVPTKIKLFNIFKITPGFYFEERSDKTRFERYKHKIVHVSREGKVLNVFNFSSFYDTVFISSDDHIIASRGSEIYSGKITLELPLSFKYPTLTFHNTKYIEITHLSSSEYLIEVLTKEYLEDTEKSLVSIFLEEDNGKKYYLSQERSLVESEEPIFIDLSRLKSETVSFEIQMERDTNYIVVGIDDKEGLFRKYDAIVHYNVEVSKADVLTLNQELVYIGRDKIDGSNKLIPVAKMQNKTVSYYLLSQLYPIYLKQEYTRHVFKDFKIKIDRSFTSTGVSDSYSSGFSFNSGALTNVIKYTTRESGLDSYSSSFSPGGISLQDFIRYTTVDKLQPDNYASSFTFDSGALTKWPILYKTVDPDVTTQTISKFTISLPKGGA